MDTPVPDSQTVGARRPDHVTAELPFGACGPYEQPLFTIAPGVRIEDALNQASLLLKGAYETTYELAENDLGHSGLIWSALHLVEAAKALVDAVVAGAPHN